MPRDLGSDTLPTTVKVPRFEGSALKCCGPNEELGARLMRREHNVPAARDARLWPEPLGDPGNVNDSGQLSLAYSGL